MTIEEKDLIARSINEQVAKAVGRIFAVYMSVLVAFFVLMFGWHQAAINKVSQQVEDNDRKITNLESDIGYMNGALKERHPEAIVFEAFYDKYVKRRSGR